MFKLLLVVTFIESLATVLVERGIYFYAYEHLAFSNAMNLSVALSLGVAYIVGALASGPASTRVGEKRLLRWTLVGQCLCHAVPVVAPSVAAVFGVSIGIGLLNGLKWPLIESYVAAGRTRQAAARSIGLFNIAWSASVPLALWVTGPFLALRLPGHWFGPGAVLFIVAGAVNLVSLALIGPLSQRPIHASGADPDRWSAFQHARLRSMLASSRWSMLAAFCLLFVVAPLMPAILIDRLGLETVWAAPFSSVIDGVRLATFVVLWRTTVWHHRPVWLAVAACGVPAGFVLIMAGGGLGFVLLGQVVFGAAMGLAYYSALYYAMLAQNASVDAGGVHEGLVGLGFFLGPLFALMGSRLAASLGGLTTGVLVGVGPLVALCLFAAVWPLCRVNPKR